MKKKQNVDPLSGKPLGDYVIRGDPPHLALQPSNLKGAAKYMKQHGLTAVSLAHFDGFRPEDTKILRDLPMITDLAIYHPKITRGDDLLALHGLRRLRIDSPIKGGLDFTAFPELEDVTCIWNDGYESLWKCRQLRKLDLICFSRDTLDGIEACRQLAWLRLEQCRLLSIQPLSALPHLRVLKLMALRRLRDVDALRQMRCLEELDTYWCPRVASWTALSDQPCLRIADIDGAKPLSARDWNWPELRKLKFRNVNPIDTLTWLRRSKKLEELVLLENTRVLDGDFHWSQHCTKLRRLDVFVPKNARYSPPIEELQATLYCR